MSRAQTPTRFNLCPHFREVPDPLYWTMEKEQRQEPLYVGTSGWVYKDWAGAFYPESLSKNDELAFYATRFNTVEINATFYRLAPVSAVKGWRNRSPEHFLFAVKGSRYITHIKRLKPTAVSIRKYFNRVKWLKEKCGPVLWQLPPNLPCDPERLDAFLKKLPPGYRHAVEFRHPSWYEDEKTFQILQQHGAAHVAISSLRMPMNLAITTDFTYIRFHGLEGGPSHDYTRLELKPWAEHCRRCLDNGIAVYAYFNNDLNTRAPLNAVMFRQMVTARTSATRRPSSRRIITLESTRLSLPSNPPGRASAVARERTLALPKPTPVGRDSVEP
jgi:uncharacterized protein YecE (DUF72 family)